MAQDFAKKKNSGSRSKSSSSGMPRWVWLLTGIVTGAFIMFLVYLSGLTPQKAGLATSGQGKPSAENSPGVANQEKPTFEFYDSLMNNEVIPPTGHPRNNADPGTGAPSASTLFILQVASFQKPEDADALKAKLTLEGLDAHIQQFNNKGETWHRVLVGPFSDSAKMSRAKTTLAQHNITPIVLQKKP